MFNNPWICKRDTTFVIHADVLNCQLGGTSLLYHMRVHLIPFPHSILHSVLDGSGSHVIHLALSQPQFETVFCGRQLSFTRPH
jgi:hypothetical protein